MQQYSSSLLSVVVVITGEGRRCPRCGRLDSLYQRGRLLLAEPLAEGKRERAAQEQREPQLDHRRSRDRSCLIGIWATAGAADCGAGQRGGEEERRQTVFLGLRSSRERGHRSPRQRRGGAGAVSYTHLTLPTKA